VKRLLSYGIRLIKHGCGKYTMKNLAERSHSFAPKGHWQKKTRLFLKTQSRHIPALEIILSKMWCFTVNVWLKLRYRKTLIENLINGYYCKNIDPDRTFWISPNIIEYSGLIEFDIQRFKGHVIAGEWDKLEMKFCDIDLYRASNFVVNEGGNWEDTLFYKRIVHKISNGEIYWNCSDEQTFKTRCENIELLFYEIKSHGYKTQKQLLRQQSLDSRKLDDEITVSVGRYGNLLFSNSAHRLVIAKLIPLEAIPTKISVRHPLWVKFVKQLNSYINLLAAKAPHSFTHPDLEQIYSSNIGGQVYNLIRQHSSYQAGELLDVGAKLGYYSSKFQDNGFNCYATEAEFFELDLLSKIKKAERYSFDIINFSNLKPEWLLNRRFDITLALSSLHYFLKTKELYSELTAILRNLNTNELFFLPNEFVDSDKHQFYKQYTPQQFVQAILLNSSLSRSELIGYTQYGTPLFRLFK